VTDRLLSTRETAELLGVRENTLVAWRSRGRSKPVEERRGPPFLTVGRSVKYRESTVHQWIADREERRSSK
jgi:predicted DNA-binding transcriptional regulator AlpA